VRQLRPEGNPGNSSTKASLTGEVFYLQRMVLPAGVVIERPVAMLAAICLKITKRVSAFRYLM